MWIRRFATKKLSLINSASNAKPGLRNFYVPLMTDGPALNLASAVVIPIDSQVIEEQPGDVTDTEAPIVHFGITQRSNRLINYFLFVYFLLGFIFASFYGTWIAAFCGGGLLAIYYSVKIALPKLCLYQYVLSVVLGLFMAQFIYQMHGMIEMHFFAFIGSALLITYQNWRLQLPMLIFVLLHHVVLGHLQDNWHMEVFFSQPHHFDPQTFIIHILLTIVIYVICGLCAFQLRRYHLIELQQTEQMRLLQEAAKLSIVRKKTTEAIQERSTILESIGDAFFAVDKNWVVTYWNKTAEKVLMKTKQEMLSRNLWSVFSGSVDSRSYHKYHAAVRLNKHVHFEDYFEPLDRWYEISAYPSAAGLSVYFKDITDRKKASAALQESEQRYSDVFHFSPLPMWVVDLKSLKFLDVNHATIVQYGYSREEFLTMTLKDIRPPDDLAGMEKALKEAKSETAGIAQLQTIHRTKSGDLLNMDIRFAPFRFNGLKTSIAIATDMTERLVYINAIEQQNERLNSISWMQSHVVRAPLVRIMGLIPLYVDPKLTSKEKRDIRDYLVVSTNELDKVIKDMTNLTSLVVK